MKRRMLILLSLLLVGVLVLGACGGDDANGARATDTADPPGRGSVTFTIAGDPDVARTVTSAYAATNVFDKVVSLLFFVNMSDLVVGITNIPYDQAPGTYPIKTTFDLNDVSAVAVHAAADYRTYTSADGTLTITEWDGDTMSGTFDFTAEKRVARAEDPATITVSGTFDNIPAPRPDN